MIELICCLNLLSVFAVEHICVTAVFILLLSGVKKNKKDKGILFTSQIPSNHTALSPLHVHTCMCCRGRQAVIEDKAR